MGRVVIHLYVLDCGPQEKILSSVTIPNDSFVFTEITADYSNMTLQDHLIQFRLFVLQE